MSDKKTQYRREYIYRVNKVVDFIERNLDSDLTLDVLANQASFSPFHFHRIFTAFMGETVNQFVRRIRTEKAASALLSYPERNISDIALEYGFNSDSIFCRTFKDLFGMSASEFREVKFSEFSKNGQSDRKNGKETGAGGDYFCDENNLNTSFIMNTTIEVKDMPALQVAYCRHIGQFNEIGNAYEKLMRWAGPRGLLRFPATKTLTVYHDDPKVTDIAKIRQSACITIDSDVRTEGEIGKMEVDGGRFAVGRFEIDEKGFEDAWNQMCLWIADNGYQAGDGYPYELYHNDHTQHPERKFILDICVPVKPL